MSETLLENLVKSLVDGAQPSLTPEEVDSLAERYPYFTLPAALLVKGIGSRLDATSQRGYSQRVALSASTPDELYMYLAPDNGSHAGFYPQETPQSPTTENVIDIFLNTYGTASAEEEEILNRLIFNPTPDYSQVLAKEEEASAPIPGEAAEGSNDDRINRFIIASRENSAPKSRPADNQQPSDTEARHRNPDSKDTEANSATSIRGVDTTLSIRQPESADNQHTATPQRPAPRPAALSESLARIFIKQKQFSRAYEIIEQLNLNFPEKSVYFADQLRFLSKLIACQKLAGEKKESVS